MGEKGNMIDTAGLEGIGSGVVGSGDVSGVGSGGGSGHRTAGMVGSVAKAAAGHVKGVGEDSVDKPTGLAGLLPTAEDEKPPAER